MKGMLFLIILALLSFNAQAAWVLNNAQSSVNFVSIKKSTVAEVHHFTSLKGALTGDEASVTIDLSSVETAIAVRNERMRRMLFNVVEFPLAQIDAGLDGSRLMHLGEGDSYQASVLLTLSLHGVKKEISSDVQVVKLSDDRVLVSSVRPVLLKASDFKLGAGIEALRDVAGLTVISTVVPVSFNLIFQK